MQGGASPPPRISGPRRERGPASGGGRARARGGAAASGSSWGRAARAWREEPPESTRRSSAGSRSRPRFYRPGWTEPRRRPAPSRSCPRRVPRPRAGLPTPPHAFPADGLGPAAAPGRCPAAGGGAAPPGIAFPDSLLPEALPGTRKRKRRRGRGQASRPRRAGTLPGGSRGVVGGPAPTQDGRVPGPAVGQAALPTFCSPSSITQVFSFSQFPRRITWSVNRGEVRGQRPGQPAGRSAPHLPFPDWVRSPSHTRVCSKFSGRSESPGVLPAVMRKSSEPSRPPGREGRDPKTTPIGKVTLWSATRSAGILPS